MSTRSKARLAVVGRHVRAWLDGAPLLRDDAASPRAASRWFAWIWALAGALVVFHCWTAVYDHDEVEHLHATWMISAGSLPYVDFMEHHHPTLWFLAAPLVGKFHEVPWLFFSARLACALAFLGTLASVRALIVRAYPRVAWQWPLLLAVSSVIYCRSSLEVRPDTFMMCAWSAGLLAWTSFLARGRLGQAAVAGLCFGAAIAILQKAIVPVALVMLAAAALVVARRVRGQAWRRLAAGAALAAGTTALPILALIAHMQSLGILREFWFWNFPFNYLLQQVVTNPGFREYSVLRNLATAVPTAPVLYAVGLVGLWRCVRALVEGRSRAGYDAATEARDVTLATVLAGYCVFLFRMRFPDIQYLIVLPPLLAVFAARLLDEVPWSRRDPLSGSLRPWLGYALQAGALAVLVVFAIVLAQYPDNRAERAIYAELLRRVPADQTLFAPPPYNPILRRDGAYFWFFATSYYHVYADVCRLTGAPDDKLARDEAMYRASPWAYAWVEGNTQDSASWSARAPDFVPAPFDPRLLGAHHLFVHK
jgi:hypothetical protein